MQQHPVVGGHGWELSLLCPDRKHRIRDNEKKERVATPESALEVELSL